MQARLSDLFLLLRLLPVTTGQRIPSSFSSSSYSSSFLYLGLSGLPRARWLTEGLPWLVIRDRGSR